MTEADVRIWTPQTPYLPATVAECIESYREYLRVLYPDHLKTFDHRRQGDRDSASAEAVVFSVLRSHRLEPSVAEVLGSGGPDFLCLPDSDRAFFVEVTALDQVAVEKRSDWPDQILDEGRWFGEITRNLCNKCAKKAPQVSGLPYPRLLAICSTHIGAGILLGPLAAEDLMVPEFVASAGDGASVEDARRIADLRSSPFVEIQDGGEMVPIRRSISGILLVAMGGDGAGVLGLLHPDPAAPFDYRTFAQVPFLRLIWPVQGGAPQTEWIVADPEPREFKYGPVALSDAELHGKTLR